MSSGRSGKRGLARSSTALFVSAFALLAAACSGTEYTGGGDGGGGGGGASDGKATKKPKPNWNAFFADDPPPKYCGPGSATKPPLPGGTPECPDDKNREGCPCNKIGQKAACWPGKRVDRKRGICKDGVTTCKPYNEFWGSWGPCEGYVLPKKGATKGANACDCFSKGVWKIENLSPCLLCSGCTTQASFTDFDNPSHTYYAVSTVTPGGGKAQCPSNANSSVPPPLPSGAWSANSLNIDCAGQFTLCYTIKAGDVNSPKSTDCKLASVCTKGWYAKAGVTQKMPVLPAWRASNTACVKRFLKLGGYGEMSVIGLSAECEKIDDNGKPYVFLRAGYCPNKCLTQPTLPECKNCGQGGSGQF